VNTTITSVLPVLAVLVVGRYILGAVTLQEFAIALLVGLIVGTYSSLFVATPIVAWLKEREATNVERQIAATKRKPDGFDIGTALADADRSRKVRSGARGEGHRVTGGSRGAVKGPTVTVTKRRNEGPVKGQETAAERAPQGDVKPRPRKKKR
jgi:preprotein translocase subunit SecF